jgi:cytochrome P450
VSASVSGEDADPYELPDTLQLGPPQDPYPHVAEARRRNAVQTQWPLPMDATLSTPNDQPSYCILGYDEVSAVFRDSETYSSARIAESIGPLLANTIVAMDGSEHRVHRALIAGAFRPKLLTKWEYDLVGPLVHELIDSFVADGEADLIRRLTFALPVRVIAGILGLPQRDATKFQRWSIEMISMSLNWERGMAAFEALRDYFAEQVERRRQDPQDDVITALVESEVEGQRLTDEQIFAFLRLLLPAGIETTYRSLGNLLFALLTHPDQLDAVLKDPTLIPAAVEEGLRWAPPIFITGRACTRASTLGGVHIPADAVLNVFIGAANRDERVFPNPDVFDVHRNPTSQLAFAVGPHACLGMHLARMENRMALSAILERLGDMRLDPAAPPPKIVGMPLRSPPSLRVRFAPVTP